LVIEIRSPFISSMTGYFISDMLMC
jgi:hypothetical protein